MKLLLHTLFYIFTDCRAREKNTNFKDASWKSYVPSDTPYIPLDIEPSLTSPLLNCYSASSQSIDHMPLLLSTSWDITETWLVSNVFSPFLLGRLLHGILAAGVGFDTLPSLLWRLASQHEDLRHKRACTWMDQVQGTYQDKAGLMLSTEAESLQLSHRSPLFVILVASFVHSPLFEPFLPSQGLCLQTGGLFLSGSLFCQHPLNIIPLTPDLILQPL